MDFQKQLPIQIFLLIVNITGQINFIRFNIHLPANATSVFYTYNETMMLKETDIVYSMTNNLYHKILSENVVIFVTPVEDKIRINQSFNSHNPQNPFQIGGKSHVN